MEIESGLRFLQQIIAILQPHALIAVGKTAEGALVRWFPNDTIAVVRHPSHGGKTEFTTGLSGAGIV